MSKEEWVHSYECAIENIGEELDIEMEEAQKVLDKRLEKDTHYLDGYLNTEAYVYE